MSHRPLRVRKSTWGLTGTPLLSSETRITELAALCAGTYVTGSAAHWRMMERASTRDVFLRTLALGHEHSSARAYTRALTTAKKTHVHGTCTHSPCTATAAAGTCPSSRRRPRPGPKHAPPGPPFEIEPRAQANLSTYPGNRWGVWRPWSWPAREDMPGRRGERLLHCCLERAFALRIRRLRQSCNTFVDPVFTLVNRVAQDTTSRPRRYFISRSARAPRRRTSRVQSSATASTPSSAISSGAR